jgi:hypothetical protein
MVQHLVVGLVVVALIIMGVLAYAQKHEGWLARALAPNLQALRIS